jgi:hypothetical protein
MFTKILPSGLALLLMASCTSASGGGSGEVKVFNNRQELARAMSEGKVKQGDKVALRDGNLDDVPGMKAR